MIDRREFLKSGTAVAAAMASGGLPAAAFAQSRPFTFVSWGGTFAKMQQTAFLDPFAASKGIETAIASPPDIAKIKGMVEASVIEWDLLVLSGRGVWRGADEGFLEPLDMSRIPNAKALKQEFVTPHGIVTSVGASVIAWANDAFPDSSPERWADFWDLKRFPGKRGMYKGLYWNYEVAMLAEGLTSEEIYPVTDEKMDMAFKKLEELRPHVAVWWTSGPQPAQLLTAGEVTLTSAWSGRIFNAIDGGAPVSFTFNNALAWGSHFCIAKGSPYADLCHELIDYSIGMGPQSKLLELNVYGPSLEAAAAKASDDVRKTLVLAPEHIGGLHFLNDREAAAYEVKYEERWNQFLLS